MKALPLELNCDTSVQDDDLRVLSALNTTEINTSQNVAETIAINSTENNNFISITKPFANFTGNLEINYFFSSRI